MSFFARSIFFGPVSESISISSLVALRSSPGTAGFKGGFGGTAGFEAGRRGTADGTGGFAAGGGTGFEAGGWAGFEAGGGAGGWAEFEADGWAGFEAGGTRGCNSLLPKRGAGVPRVCERSGVSCVVHAREGAPVFLFRCSQ